MSTSEGRTSGRPERAVQQAPGLWLTDLQQHEVCVPGSEVVQDRVDIGRRSSLVLEEVQSYG